MPRYIDLNNPKVIYMGRDKFGNGIYHIPPDVPTADVVEVVRCKDCIYSPYKQACNLPYGINGYCPLGKRREDE